MRIAVVDVDAIHKAAKFPNLACMKMVSYYKRQGHETDFYCRKYPCVFDYDRILCSKVFSDTPFDLADTLVGNIICGGTGFRYYDAEPLPEDIEHTKPLYGLYNSCDPDFCKTSIGYTTRGCIRGCEFCVNRDSRASVPHSPVSEFMDESLPYITLLDDNVWACNDWASIWDKLMATGKPFCYKQGLDIRLMTEAKAEALGKCKYHGAVYFSFDNYADREIIIRKLDLLKRVSPKLLNNSDVRVYCLCNFYKQGWKDIEELLKRIVILQDYGALPYVMRYKGTNNMRMLTAIARWCNQPRFFKSMTLAAMIDMEKKQKTYPIADMMDHVDNGLLRQARIL